MKKLKKQWNKVTVLLLTFGIVFGLFGAMPVQAQDGTASGSTIFDVKIVHTNDIHARVEEDDYNQVIGMDRLSGIAQTFTEGADGSLMLDSGDTFHGQPIATLVKGESVAKLMKACGYDAMTTGNHDWSYGKDRLKELGGIANVKILSGNIKNADGTSFFDTDELVKEITKNGKTLKIGVFGVSDPEMKNKTTPSNVEGLGKLPGIQKFHLTNRIRTNAELSSFIQNMLHLPEKRSSRWYPHIVVMYANNDSEAENFLNDFAGQGYQQRMPEGSGQLGIQAVRDAEKIVVLLDEQYYYDEKGYLRSRCSAEKYSSVRKLFHLLNQAKESLALVVRENMAVYEVMMEILQMHRNR